MSNLSWKKFKISEIFDNIQQWARLKNADQIPGKIPFVMAWVTNTGVTNYIGNSDTRFFSKNSLTVDIFWNTFYRNYDFWAGDDVWVFWSSNKNFSPYVLRFIQVILAKQLFWKYDFGKKLRASQTYNIEISLPTKNGEIDFEFMSDFISTIEKIVIADLVDWTNEKMDAYKKVVRD